MAQRLAYFGIERIGAMRNADEDAGVEQVAHRRSVVIVVEVGAGKIRRQRGQVAKALAELVKPLIELLKCRRSVTGRLVELGQFRINGLDPCGQFPALRPKLAAPPKISSGWSWSGRPRQLSHVKIILEDGHLGQSAWQAVISTSNLIRARAVVIPRLAGGNQNRNITPTYGWAAFRSGLWLMPRMAAFDRWK